MHFNAGLAGSNTTSTQNMQMEKKNKSKIEEK